MNLFEELSKTVDDVKMLREAAVKNIYHHVEAGVLEKLRSAAKNCQSQCEIIIGDLFCKDYYAATKDKQIEFTDIGLLFREFLKGTGPTIPMATELEEINAKLTNVLVYQGLVVKDISHCTIVVSWYIKNVKKTVQ